MKDIYLALGLASYAIIVLMYVYQNVKLRETKLKLGWLESEIKEYIHHANVDNVNAGARMIRQWIARYNDQK